MKKSMLNKAYKAYRLEKIVPIFRAIALGFILGGISIMLIFHTYFSIWDWILVFYLCLVFSGGRK